jgi:hypothetical protein
MLRLLDAFRLTVMNHVSAPLRNAARGDRRD